MVKKMTEEQNILKNKIESYVRQIEKNYKKIETLEKGIATEVKIAKDEIRKLEILRKAVEAAFMRSKNE